ncbi:hypothetical protein SM124_05950 [Bacillus sp. 31A1R]|uniref:DUF4030 domain-containing protein n=1 Tax=Robertmurraya mangrovi TaxID=3098077 RepID=A0ABU5IVX3_9BACI|nr:hypothetical protein [Bacillus sp. 31A1R]MDZ5471285.1 hypothetical protein [Bacillus sp. 31A1R]
MEFNKKTWKKKSGEPVSPELKKFINNLPTRYEEGEFDEERVNQVDREWNAFQSFKKMQWTVTKKAGLATLSAAAACAIFIGSGFISPAMADVVSKFPPLKSLYEKRQHIDMSSEITNKLVEDGYPVKEVIHHVYSLKKGAMYVFLDDTEGNIEKASKEIIEISNNILKQDERYDDYSIKVRKYVAPSQEHLAEEERERKEWDEISRLVSPVLEKYNYNQSWGGGKNKVTLEFAKEEDENKVEQIVKAVETALKEGGREDIEVDIYRFGAERAQEGRWGNALAVMFEELGSKNKYNVKGLGYKSDKQVMKIFITLDKESKDSRFKENADLIIGMIDEFIARDEVQAEVKGDKYEIVLKDKSGKEIK